MTRIHVRSGTLGIATALAVLLAGCGGDDDPTGPNGGGGGGGGGTTPVVTTSVMVQAPSSFSPAAIQVSPGAVVTWTWAASAGTHNVTFANGSIASSPGDLSSGTFQSTMPTAAGTYTYQCTLHPGMTGSVLVQ